MKIFKTILWTSFFWILVIIGLWVASIFYPYYASIVIHPNVKHAIIELWYIDEARANWEQEPVKTEEDVTPPSRPVEKEDVAPIEEITPAVEEEIEITNEEADIEDMKEPEQITPAQSTSSILPKQKETKETSDEVKELQNKVDELEWKYNALVEELQTIFNTPLFSQLLSQAFNQTEEVSE